MPLLWWARLETEHFTFDAFGRTYDEANEYLRMAVERHAREYRLPADWWQAYDVAVVSPSYPGAMRDRETYI